MTFLPNAAVDRWARPIVTQLFQLRDFLKSVELEKYCSARMIAFMHATMKRVGVEDEPTACFAHHWADSEV